MLGYALEHLIAEEDSLDPIGDELEQHTQYLHRFRRVQVGPAITVVFENTQTLWLRLRELARLARATEPTRVHREMHWYDSLLPGPGRLLASVSVRAANREFVRHLGEGAVELWIGDHRIRGHVRADSGGDRIVGLVRWVEFAIARADRAALLDRELPWTLLIEVGGESFETGPLSSAVRTSLLRDLHPRKS